MLDTVQGGNPPTQDPSIDLTSQFSAMDDGQLKQKEKHNEPAKGKDGHLKIGVGSEDLEGVLPLSRLPWDKKRGHGQIKVIDEDKVKNKMIELCRTPPRAAHIRIIVWRDAVGRYGITWAAYRRSLSPNLKGVSHCPFGAARVGLAILWPGVAYRRHSTHMGFYC